MKRSRSEVARGSEAPAKTQQRGKDSTEMMLQAVESSSSSFSSSSTAVQAEEAGAATGVWDLTSELGGGGQECWGSWWWGVEEEKLLGWFPFADEHFVSWWCEEVEEESRGGDDIWQLQSIHEIPVTAKQ